MTAQTITPDVDIHEHADSIVILADMPGVDEKHIDVTLENGVLTLIGRSETPPPAGLDLLYREWAAVEYRRSFTLATDVDRERIAATIRNGILRVTLPKTAKAQPRKIEVQHVT